MSGSIGEDVRGLVVCPRDRGALEWTTEVRCDQGHRYPIVGGIPILLVDADPTGFSSETMRAIDSGRFDASDPAETGAGVDRVVQDAIVRTNGNLYRHLVGRLPRYPIPEIRLPRGEGRLLLDVGGGWGRWSIAAARAGYRPVLVDPQLELVLAAARVARQLGVDVATVCGDATALPLPRDTVDVAFSYSVLQHFAKPAAKTALREMRRVVRSGGTVVVQLANRWGPRQVVRRLVRSLGPKDPDPFRLRSWSLREMQDTFTDLVGPSDVEVDGFFSLNAQTADLDLMPASYRRLIRTSEWLRRWSDDVPALRYVADSLSVRSAVGDPPLGRSPHGPE